MNQNNEKIFRVVSAVADINSVTFYLDDGQVIIVKQTDPRLNKLLETIIPITTRGHVAVISLNDFSVYEEFTKKSNGFVRFFTAAKNKITSFFSEPEEVTLPSINKEENIPTASKSKQELTKEIIKSSSPIKPMDQIKPDETVIAVIGDTVIPNVEKIYPYIARSLNTNSAKSIENFLKRLVPVMDKRKHSVEDVFRFLEKGDLPIADDGCIIAYKLLNKQNNDTFVDIHTGKVTQRVGSYVIVDESLVDPNRHRDCSNGIHVARRDYLGSFSGNVCTLIKLPPENIIAVPHGDPRKVRTTGYHIIGVISPEGTSALKRNNHMTNSPLDQRLLASAISGKHIARIEEVRITGHLGEGVVVTPLIKSATRTPKANKEDISKAKSLDVSVINDKTSPKELNKKIQEEKKKISKEKAKEATKPSKVKPEPKKQVPDIINAVNLYQKWQKTNKSSDFNALMEFKRKKKQSWTKLGLNAIQIKNIESMSKK